MWLNVFCRYTQCRSVTDGWTDKKSERQTDLLYRSINAIRSCDNSG